MMSVTFAYLIENETSQNKTKTQSQRRGCLRYCKYLLLHLIYLSLMKPRSCYDRMDLYCLQAVTLGSRVRDVDGAHLAMSHTWKNIQKGTGHKPGDSLFYIWAWHSLKSRITPADKFRVMKTKAKALYTSQHWKINYRTNIAPKL